MIRMTRSFKRLLFLAVSLYSLFWLSGFLHRQLERFWPNSPVIPNIPLCDVAVINSALETDHWVCQDGEAEILSWSNFYGWVPGKVSLVKWASSNRTYYKIRGPIDPDYGRNGREYPICQVFLPIGFDFEQWEITLRDNEPVAILQRDRLKKPLPARQIKIIVEDSYVTVTFWVPHGTIVGNIVFNYEEDEYTASVATEIPGTKGHDNILTWEMP
jgi:hypothetical protein